MKRFLCEKLPTAENPVALSPEESRHAVQVFRMRDGDRVEALDGQGHIVQATLRIRGKTNVTLEFAGEVRADGATQIVPVVLELSVLKGPAMEWAIEKATELGVKSVQPLFTERTVVQTGKKSPESFVQRWQKISDQALKQCGRLTQMTIAAPTTLEGLLRSPIPHRLFCDEQPEGDAPFLSRHLRSLSPKGEVHLLIGPEGGWAPAERRLLLESCTAVSLGPLIQRAETAALFASSLAAAHFREHA